jgi:hypothetical protein
MTTFVFRVKAPRPTFALDMTAEEQEVMGAHAVYWQPMIDSGQMVVFGPVARRGRVVGARGHRSRG